METKDAMVISKSILSIFEEQSSGLGGEISWPVSRAALLELYKYSAEHGRCIQIKAAGAFGNGFYGPNSETVEKLCATGSADVFMELGVDLESFGNAFLEVTIAGNRIIGLSRLPAFSMTRLASGGYRQCIYQPDGGEVITDFAPDEVIHLRHPCPKGDYYALPTWVGADPMLRLLEAAVDYNTDFFDNHAIPAHVITSFGTPLSPDQKEAAKTFFQNEFKGEGKHHRALYLHLPGRKEDTGIDFKDVSSRPKDGEFLKLLDLVRDRIPIAHGVPPRMLGIVAAGQLGGGGEVTGQMFVFEQFTLKPLRRRVMDQLRHLWQKLDIDPMEHGFTPIDMTPPSNDSEKLPALVDSNILSTEEARSILGLSKGKNSRPTARQILQLMKCL